MLFAYGSASLVTQSFELFQQSPVEVVITADNELRVDGSLQVRLLGNSADRLGCPLPFHQNRSWKYFLECSIGFLLPLGGTPPHLGSVIPWTLDVWLIRLRWHQR